MADGDPVLIAGANDIEYNGTHQVNYIDADTFSFHVDHSPATPATGTITCTGYTSSYFKLTKHVKALGKIFSCMNRTGISTSRRICMERMTHRLILSSDLENLTATQCRGSLAHAPKSLATK